MAAQDSIALRSALPVSLEGVSTPEQLADVERHVAGIIDAANSPSAQAERDVMRRVVQGAHEFGSTVRSGAPRPASPAWSLTDAGADLVARSLVDAWSDSSAPIGAALSRAQESFAQRLQAEGLSRGAVALMLTLVNITADARVAQQQITSKRAELSNAGADRPQSGVRIIDSDPLEPLSAAEIGERLGLSDQTVRGRERAGQLFSILRTGRKRGQEFPAFQTWEGVVGQPLEASLAALIPAGQTAPVSGSVAYGFFTSPTDLLADLAPVEVLLGRQLSSRAVDPHASVLLADTPANRLAMVLETARTFASSDYL